MALRAISFTVSLAQHAQPPASSMERKRGSPGGGGTVRATGLNYGCNMTMVIIRCENL